MRTGRRHLAAPQMTSPEHLLRAWCCSMHFTNINSSNSSYEEGITIMPNLQVWETEAQGD